MTFWLFGLVKKYLQQEVGRAWVCLPLGMSLGEGKPRLSLPLVGGIYQTNKLIIELETQHKDNTVEMKEPSLIEEKIEMKEILTQFYSFKSRHPEQVIIDSLRKIFPPGGDTSTTLVIREWLSTTKEDHLFTLKVETTAKDLSWPKMESNLIDIFREQRRL